MKAEWSSAVPHPIPAVPILHRFMTSVASFSSSHTPNSSIVNGRKCSESAASLWRGVKCDRQRKTMSFLPSRSLAPYQTVNSQDGNTLEATANGTSEQEVSRGPPRSSDLDGRDRKYE